MRLHLQVSRIRPTSGATSSLSFSLQTNWRVPRAKLGTRRYHFRVCGLYLEDE